MLKLLIILLMFNGLVTFGSEQSITHGYDLIEILNNKEVLDSYIHCILDKSSCTPSAQHVKDNIPEALVNNCEKCPPADKIILKQAANFIKANRPDDWEKILEKYDPSSKYRVPLSKFLAEE